MRTIETAGGTIVVARRPKDLTVSHGTYIGGTDIAAILGVSENTTRFAVWAHKVHAKLTDDNRNIEERDAGTFYEPYILRRFGQRFDVNVVPTQLTFRRTRALYLGANPDGIVFRKEVPAPSHRRAPRGILTDALGIVDAKTRSPFQRGAWGDDGTADVPADEFCQCQWYMELLDLTIAYLAVFFDRQLSVFVLPRDRELGALMVEEATAFWNEFVVPKKEPPFEGPAAADYLVRKFPRVKIALQPAEPPDDILVARRELILRHMEALQSHLDAVEGALKKRIGDAAGLSGNGYTARWFETQGRNAVQWKAVVAELRSFPVVADETVAWAIRKQIDEAIARFTTKSEGSRTFKVYFAKGPRRLPTVELPELPAAAEKGEPDGHTPDEEPPD